MGINGGLVSKLGMKEAFNFHFILDPSVAKRCKRTSVDIETTLNVVEAWEGQVGFFFDSKLASGRARPYIRSTSSISKWSNFMK